MHKILTMYKKLFIVFFVFSISMSFIFTSYNFTNTDFKNILLINSYHDGYEWSDDTKDAIKDVFDLSGIDYNLKIEHMDTKNISSDKYLEDLFNLYKSKYDKDDFDVIMCSDDNALKFLLKYRDQLFADTPVFFCGINKLDTHDFTNRLNVYGVVEKDSIVETTEIALKLNPSIKNVYLVVDDSLTGRATKRSAIKDMSIYENILNFEIVKGDSYEEILEFTSRLDPLDSIVIQSFYVVDKDGTTYPLEYTAKKLIERSNAPVYGVFPFGFGQGSVGGKFLEGHTQGSTVAMMVLDYMEDGKYNGDQFIIDTSVNHSYFDYKIIKKLGYDIKVLPEDSIIINKPINFYRRNKRLIDVSIIIFGLLLLYVYILRRQVTIQADKIVKAQNQLMASEKMASLGRLVAGISHEINTPIGIGVSLSSYIKKETENLKTFYLDNKLCPKEQNDYLDDMINSSQMIIDAMKRASLLIQSFKQVAVDQSIDEKRTVEVKNYLHEVVSSLKSELKKKDIDISIESYETLEINIYTGAIYQIFSNLIMNSLKHGFSKTDSGKIEIKIARRSYTYPILKNDELYIVYRDNGEGIDEANISKIYDPFYTTKLDEGGSGLGLNIVYNLVIDKLEGTIECTSEAGKYTQFEIKFPIEYKNIKKNPL